MCSAQHYAGTMIAKLATTAVRQCVSAVNAGCEAGLLLPGSLLHERLINWAVSSAVRCCYVYICSMCSVVL